MMDCDPLVPIAAAVVGDDSCHDDSDVIHRSRVEGERSCDAVRFHGRHSSPVTAFVSS